jgi:hypothetical protein
VQLIEQAADEGSVEERIALNDPRLAGVIRAGGGADEEIERLLAGVADPLIAAITGRYVRPHSTIGPADAEDIHSAVHLRLVGKLRALAVSRADAVRDFERYTVTVTFNVINDHLRRLFPERARLKGRLRYTMTHDPRLALWFQDGVIVAGLSEWRGSSRFLADIAMTHDDACEVMLDRNRPADALVALFRRIEAPVALEAVIMTVAALWGVADVPAANADRFEAEDRSLERMELREYLRSLWAEIRDLRPMQRKALLLNLRSAETPDVTSLLVLTGIVPFDELAAVLDMTAEELASIWSDLPLDDLRIAALLGITRQQVINLRKAARERLGRRMSR